MTETKIKLRTVAELKLNLAEIEQCYEGNFINSAHERFQNTLEAALIKIASGSCGHAPTWARYLVETGKKIAYFEEE